MEYDIGKRYSKFWSDLFRMATSIDNDSKLLLPAHWEKPRSGNHVCFKANTSIKGIKYCYLPRSEYTHVALRVHRGKTNKDESSEIYKSLYDKKNEIEKIFDSSLDWDPYRIRNMSTYKVQVTFHQGISSNFEEWVNLHTWMIKKMRRMRRAFDPFIEQLKF